MQTTAGDSGMETRSAGQLGKMSPKDESKCVMLPYELWSNLRENRPSAVQEIETSIRLFSGAVVERLLISAFGDILGQKAVDSERQKYPADYSILNLRTQDIEAVQVPASHFWRRSRWLSLNPRHPARKRQNNIMKEQQNGRRITIRVP